MRRSFHPVTTHLQNHQITYRLGFPFCLSASRDGTKFSMRDLQEIEEFICNLGLPPLPDEDPVPLPATPKPASNPGRIWTTARQKSQRAFSTPQRYPFPRIAA